MYKCVDAAFSRAFGWYGEKVGRYPWAFIFGCILVNGLLGIGLMRLKTSNDMLRLYTPEDSRAAEDKVVIERLFHDRSGDSYFGFQRTNDGKYGEVFVRAKYGGNVLSEAAWYDLLNLHKEITNIYVTDEATNETFTYDDVCARRFGECVVGGKQFLSPAFRKAYHAGNVTFPFYISPELGPINLRRLLGKVNEKSSVVEAEYLKMRYALRQDTENMTEISSKWEITFLNEMANISESFDDIEVAYVVSASLNRELDANTDGDVRLFSFTFVIMITYASFVAAGGNWVSSRAHLARAGVLAVLMAILGAFGLVSACGVPFTNIVGIMPFLVLGIGIDDTFVMMSGWLNSNYDDDVPQRLASTLKTSGIAISVTSLTDFAAFVVGIISVFPSIRMFCIYTGVAVILCYINHVTFFAGCIAVHGWREKARRHCLTCMTIPPRKKVLENGGSCCLACLCSGAPARSKEGSESICEKIPRMVLPRVVLLRPVKAIIILLYMGYLGVSVWGTYNLKQGLLLENLVAPDSHFLKHSQWAERHFEWRFLVGLYVTEEVQYHLSDTQRALFEVVKDAQKDDSIHSQFHLSWLEEYRLSPFYDNSSEAAFIANLKNQFLVWVPRFKNDIVFSADEKTIIASRSYIQTENVVDTQEQGRSMLFVRGVADNIDIKVIAYAPPYIYFEQYVEVLPNTLLTVGVAVAAMFVISIIFMPHPLLVIYITLSIASILVGVVGMMYFWDLTLSSITMIHLVMCVGFSVDYCAHICHAYMQAEAVGRHARVASALSRIGGPVLNGAVSSLLGILLLVGSNSYVFSSFFRIMVLVICFGTAHGLLFLPVFLSCVGPMPTGRGVNIEKIRVMPQLGMQNMGKRPPSLEQDGMPELKSRKEFDPNFQQSYKSISDHGKEFDPNFQQSYKSISDPDFQASTPD